MVAVFGTNLFTQHFVYVKENVKETLPGNLKIKY